MKKITKENKGITLVALIITVVIMLILASVTTYTGMEVYKNSKVTAFVAQMQLLQAKVDNIKDIKTVEELQILGTTISNDQTSIINSVIANGEISSADPNDFRYFTKDELLEIFDIDDAYDDVMINFTTREVVSINGIEYKGEKYYTQYRLPNGENIINTHTDTSREINFKIETSIDGLNCSLTINNISISNGTVKFIRINENEEQGEWKTITNYTEKEQECSVNISRSGSYIFRLQDNTDSENYLEKTISINLTNRPKTNLELNEYNYNEDSRMWSYVQKDESYYVWIPRFAYQTDEDDNIIIKFIKGNSNIATDDSYIDKAKWNILDKFNQENEVELTGIWVKVDSENKTGLDMIELLNSNVEILTNI